MRCINCGASFEEGTKECPFCGSHVHSEIPLESTVNGVNAEQTALNPLIDKEYDFSGNDLVVRGRWGVNVNVKVGEDRLYFETIPAKKNVLPAIMLEDIMAIENNFHMRTANIVIAVIGLILGFCGGVWFFLAPILVLLLYRERKIRIHIRNGNILTIYSSDKEIANQFVEDMKKITKIRQ